MPAETTLISPLDGTVVPLEKVPDPVFSEHMLGNGMAILPASQTVFAPLDGTVTNINAALHALVIKHGDMEVLIHVGLESVSLKGEGFQVFVQKGQKVSAGQKLLSFDLNILAKKAASTLVILVITAPTDACITPLADEKIKTGMDVVLVGILIVCAIIPDSVIPLCMMKTMSCHSTMKPWTIAFCIVLTVLSVLDSVFYLKRKKQ